MRKKLLSVMLSAAMVISVSASSGASCLASADSVSSQAYTWKNVAVGGGGYVDDIIFNTGEENLIYARTDMGGAYRWDNTNSKWVCLSDWISMDDWNYMGCDSLATDPVDTSRVYIQAGTYTNDWTDSNGAVLRSDDYGETWETTELPFKVGANMQGRQFGERMVVDPNSDNVLYMGTRGGNGLWKSTDYGATWSKVTSFTEVGDYKLTDEDSTSYDDTYTGVLWVTPDSTSSTSGTPCQTIYVGVANRVGENSVFVTTDGGSTWSAVAGQPTYSLTPEGTTTALPLIPGHGVLSSDGVLYIPYTDSSNVYSAAKGDVWKYNTKTSVWTEISPVLSTSSDDYFGYGGLSVDAQDPDTLIVSTDEEWWPDANFYRSTDGGATWTPFWEWNGYPNRTLRYTQDITASPWLEYDATDPEPDVKLGWMIGNVSIDPFNSDRMMYGTGATVYATDNLTDIDSGGIVALYVDSKGIEQTVANSLISPTTGDNHLITGLSDCCGYVYSDLDTVPDSMMTSPAFSSTTGMDFAELNPKKYVRVGSYTSACSSARIAISYSTGESWYGVNNCWTSSSTDTTAGGNVAMSADGGTIVWSPNSSTLATKYSTDTGYAWTACSGAPAQASLASDRVNSDKFYAYSSGTFYVSTDGGATFTATVSSGLPTTANVCMKAMPGVEGDIWLAGGSSDDGAVWGLWHSTDSGATFTKVSSVTGADTIGFGKAADGEDYMALYMEGKVSGVRGIFRSDDAGTTWTRINDDTHQYGTANSSITGDPRIYGRVYVGTNGRGTVYGDIATSTATISSLATATATTTAGTAPTLPSTVTATYSDGTTGNVKVTWASIAASSYAAAGTFTVTGTVSGTTLTTTCTVTVKAAPTISSLATATATTVAGTAPTLPATVTATYSDGTTGSVSVTWAAVAASSYAAAGTFTVTGTVSGTALTTACTVTVTSAPTITSLGTATAATTVGTAPTLPSTVTATYSDKTTASVGVTWAAVAASSYAAAGTFTVTGTVSGTALTTTCTVTVSEASDLEVQMFNSNTSATTNGISPHFKITNNGSTAIDLSTITLRYYFTENGTASNSFWCDYSTAGSSYVTGAFTTLATALDTADTYLEIGFTSSAGTLAAGSSVEVQARFAKSDWSSYTQTDDYSFNSSGSAYTDWTKVTAYQNGTLVWGTEP